MSSIGKIFGEAEWTLESELNLMRVSRLDPGVIRDVGAALAQAKKKDAPALMAYLEEILDDIKKSKNEYFRRVESRFKPIVNKLAVVMFKQEVVAQKKQIINSFLRVEKRLDTILDIILTERKKKNLLKSGVSHIEKAVKEFKANKNIFLSDIFKVKTTDDVLEIVSLFSELSENVRNLYAFFANKDEKDPEFADQPKSLKKLKENQTSLLNNWNKIPHLLLKIFEDAYRRIQPSGFIGAAKQQGVEMIQAKS